MLGPTPSISPNPRLRKNAPPPWPRVRAHRAKPRPVWKNASRYDKSCRATQRQGFSWASVAASAIAAPVANSINNSLFGDVAKDGLRYGGSLGIVNQTAKILAESTTSALVSATTRVAIVGGKLDWVAVSADALSSFVSSRISRDNAIQSASRGYVAEQVPAPVRDATPTPVEDVLARNAPVTDEQARAQTDGRTAKQQAALDYALANPVGRRSDSDPISMADQIHAQFGYDQSFIRNASYVDSTDRFVTRNSSDDSAFQRDVSVRKSALNFGSSDGQFDLGIGLGSTPSTIGTGFLTIPDYSNVCVNPDYIIQKALDSHSLPDVIGLSQSDKTAVYTQMYLSSTDKDGLDAFNKGQAVIFGMRVPTEPSANGGRGLYDDRVVVLQQMYDGNTYLQYEGAYTTDPSGHYQGKEGTLANADKIKDLGRLHEGTYLYSWSTSDGKGPTVNGSYNVLRPTESLPTDRYFGGAWHFDEDSYSANRTGPYGESRSMLFHTGYVNVTGSAGCQTFPVVAQQSQFQQFSNVLVGTMQKQFYYTLKNM